MSLNIVPSKISISIDEGSPKWTCALDLLNIEDFNTFKTKDTFEITLDNVSFNFYVTSKNLSRNEIDDFSFSVNGESLSIDLDPPYSFPLTQTFTTVRQAKELVLELLENRVTWDTDIFPDWPLEIGSLNAENASTLSFCKEIVEAGGGVLEAYPNGNLYVRPLHEYSPHPNSPKNYSTATNVPLLTEVNHIFSANVDYTSLDYFDYVRVRNKNDQGSDVIDFEQCEGNPLAGYLRVYPHPWRDVRLITTSPSDITLTFIGIEEREEEDTIEIFEGSGSVKFPITEILEITWNEINLTSLSFSDYDNKVFSTHPTEKNSMAVVKYRTKCYKYFTNSSIEQEVQYITEDWSI